MTNDYTLTTNSAAAGQLTHVYVHIETRAERMLRKSNEMAEQAVVCGLMGFDALAEINAYAADLYAELAVIVEDLECL